MLFLSLVHLSVGFDRLARQANGASQAWPKGSKVVGSTAGRKGAAATSGPRACDRGPSDLRFGPTIPGATGVERLPENAGGFGLFMKRVYRTCLAQT